jgi:hypothetical protein
MPGALARRDHDEVVCAAFVEVSPKVVGHRLGVRKIPFK